jgi:integrase
VLPRCYPGVQKIGLRLISGLRAGASEFTIWDAQLAGFGVRVRPTGAMSFVVLYRAGTGRCAPQRRFTIGAVGKLAPEAARMRAKAILGEVARGHDPAAEKTDERETLTVAALADRFMTEHVAPKLKPTSAALYEIIVRTIVKPNLGSVKADKLDRAAVAKLHAKLRSTPTHANRVLTIIASMYSFGGRAGIVPEDFIPTRKIIRYREARRERFLTSDELERVGAALREAETVGIPWEEIDESAPNARHLVKPENRRTKLDPFSAAALRLLMLTGARRNEILHLRWEHVDLERGALFLPDSKTGPKAITLNAPAMEVLANLPRLGVYVIASSSVGTADEQPRRDLKRAWALICGRAEIEGVRLHDLRHSYASVGAAGGLGLPIIGKLLGHAKPATTARYAHLADDPVRRGAEAIGATIAAALAGKRRTKALRIK